MIEDELKEKIDNASSKLKAFDVVNRDTEIAISILKINKKQFKQMLVEVGFKKRNYTIMEFLRKETPNMNKSVVSNYILFHYFAFSYIHFTSLYVLATISMFIFCCTVAQHFSTLPQLIAYLLSFWLIAKTSNRIF